MRKLLLITNNYPFGTGEIAFLHEEVNEIIKSQKYELTIVSHNKEGEQYVELPSEINIVRVRKVNIFSGIIRMLGDHNFYEELLVIFKKSYSIKQLLGRIWLIIKNYGYSHAGSEAIYRQLGRNFEPDIIYSYWGTINAYENILLARKYTRAKSITRFHGYDLYEERNKCLWQPFRMAFQERMNYFVFISKMGKDYYQQRWKGKIASNQFRINYLGTSKKDNQYILNPENSRKNVIVSCSSVIGLKRVHLIIDALSLIENEMIEWHHLGDGPLLKEMQDYAYEKLKQKLNIKYVFEGYVENKEILNLYECLQPQLFISTSQTEGIPVSMMEALSVGVPILATNVGGVHELVENGSTGRLLSANPAAEEIAGAIIQHINLSVSKKKMLSENAFDIWNAKFNIEKNTGDFLKLLEEL